MKKKHLSKAATVLFLATAFMLQPAIGRAQPFLMTGYVPELATPTVDAYFVYHDDQLGDYNLKGATLGVRLSYVVYPAMEALIGINLLQWDLESKDESGFKMDFGLKYQFTRFAETADVALAALGGFGQTGTIDIFDFNLLALVSKEQVKGLTPFLGVGFAYTLQDFNGTIGFPADKDSKVVGVVYGGLKLKFTNHMGAALEGFYKDGAGATLGFNYRF
jgi:hypothetical protein